MSERLKIEVPSTAPILVADGQQFLGLKPAGRNGSPMQHLDLKPCGPEAARALVPL